MRFWSALLYVALVCLVYFLANYPSFSGLWNDVPYPRALGFLFGTVYYVTRIGLVMAWFSVFPAWFFAQRQGKYWVRVLLYFAGIMFFFLFPFYLNPLVEEGAEETWRDIAVATSFFGSMLVALVQRPVAPISAAA